MYDRSVTVDSLAAWACWITGAVVAVGVWVGFAPNDSGYAAVAVIAFGHLVSTHRAVRRLAERERVAFELGQEAGLRSVRR